jgi:hypothetical protein
MIPFATTPNGIVQKMSLNTCKRIFDTVQSNTTLMRFMKTYCSSLITNDIFIDYLAIIVSSSQITNAVHYHVLNSLLSDDESRLYFEWITFLAGEKTVLTKNIKTMSLFTRSITDDDKSYYILNMTCHDYETCLQCGLYNQELLIDIINSTPKFWMTVNLRVIYNEKVFEVYCKTNTTVESNQRMLNYVLCNNKVFPANILALPLLKAFDFSKIKNHKYFTLFLMITNDFGRSDEVKTLVRNAVNYTERHFNKFYNDIIVPGFKVSKFYHTNNEIIDQFNVLLNANVVLTKRVPTNKLTTKRVPTKVIPTKIYQTRSVTRMKQQ